MNSVSAADVAGKITLKGKPPEEKKLPLDPACGRLHETTPTTRFYVVGEKGELADVYVHIKKGVPEKKYEVSEKPLVIDQVGCEYIPYVAAAQTGQKIIVKNSDPVLHNVHPTPTVAGNKEYNKAQLPKGPDLVFSWDNPEQFLRFKCDVHPWMFSYVSLTKHPYFSVSKKDGTFEIKNLPPGKYEVEAFHRKLGKQSKEITVEGDKATVDFTFEIQ